MILILNTDNVIVNIVDTIQTVQNGILTTKGEQSCIYGDNTLTTETIEIVPSNVIPQKYKYINSEFVLNTEYLPYISNEDRMQALEEAILALGGL